MKKMTAMKKTLACLCAACIAAGAFSASGRGEVCVSADENTSESEGSAEEAAFIPISCKRSLTSRLR